MTARQCESRSAWTDATSTSRPSRTIADPIAAALDLGQVVRRQEHRPAGGARLCHQGQELALHHRIEPRRRLVQHQQPLVAHEGLDDRDLLAIAARQLPDRDGRVELQPLRQRAPRAALQAAQAAQDVELVGGRQVARGRPARCRRTPRPGGRAGPRASSRVRRSRRLPGARSEEAHEHANRRRLAGAVRTEEAEGLAFGDLEADVDDAAPPSVAAGQMAELDRRHLIPFVPIRRAGGSVTPGWSSDHGPASVTSLASADQPVVGSAGSHVVRGRQPPATGRPVATARRPSCSADAGARRRRRGGRPVSPAGGRRRPSPRCPRP